MSDANGTTPWNAHRARVVIKAIRRGHGLRTAAGLARVTRQTVRAWSDERPTFALEVEEARALFVDEVRGVIVGQKVANPVLGTLDVKLAERLLAANEKDWAETASMIRRAPRPA